MMQEQYGIGDHIKTTKDGREQLTRIDWLGVQAFLCISSLVGALCFRIALYV
jgi:hypothetical protein